MATDAEFEHDKWRQEIELRSREVVVKEKQLLQADREHALKEQDARRSRWVNPLTIAVLAAGFAALGNAGVSWFNARQASQMENDKAEAARILEVIKVGDPRKAAINLQFLGEVGLLGGERKKDVEAYLANVKQRGGEGAVLPATARVTQQINGIPASQIEAMEAAAKSQGASRVEKIKQFDGTFTIIITH